MADVQTAAVAAVEGVFYWCCMPSELRAPPKRGTRIEGMITTPE